MANHRDERIGRILNDFLDRKAAGESVTERELFAEHPDLAEELREHLRVLQEVPTEEGPDLSGRPRQVSEGSAISYYPEIPGYRIVREIHRGGQGVVYQAIQKATRQKVAIKVTLDGPFAGLKARARFEREVELAASLKHPNIIAVHDSGVSHDRYYLVMDYVRGQDVVNYVATKRLGVKPVLRLFVKICDAVDYAHRRGVIHRDLKPSNVLVDGHGEPRVVDFGLAKVAGTGVVGEAQPTLLSITGQVIGTLAYMSPEQAAGQHDAIDIRTDVYALGVLLLQLLTGTFPYPIDAPVSTVLRHIVETPPASPRRVWHADSGVATASPSDHRRPARCPIDGELETIIIKALQKEPDRRYQSAREMMRDIGHYLANEPLETRRDSGLYLLKKALQRHKVPVAVCAVFLLVICTALVVSVMLWAQAVRERDAASAARRAAEESRQEAEHARAEIESTNRHLRLISRAFAWRELVQPGPVPSAGAEAWMGVRSYLLDEMVSTPQHFEALPELRRLAEQVRTPPADSDDPADGLYCFPRIILQRREQHSTFSWLDAEQVPLHPGDRLQLVLATSRPLYVQVYSLDSEGTARRLFPESEHHEEARILLYAPAADSEQWWTVVGPPGQETLFVVGRLSNPVASEAITGQLARIGHHPRVILHGFYHMWGSPDDVAPPNDEYWKAAQHVLASTCDFQAIISFHVVGREAENVPLAE